MRSLRLCAVFLLACAEYTIGQSSYRLIPGSSAAGVDKASDVRGIILLGAHTIGNINYYKIAKLDYYGNKLWDKYISDFPYYHLPGDTDIRIEVNNVALNDCRNGYLLSSYIDSSVVIHDSTNYQAFYWDSLQLIKLDTSGNFLWRKFYDVPITYSDQPMISEDASGSLFSMSKSYLLKTDSMGNSLWCINIQDTTQAAFNSFDITSSNHIIIAGADNINPFLLKLDSSGNFVAAKYFNVGLNKKVVSVIANNDGYSLLLDNGAGNASALLIKTDSLLNIIWSETLGINSTSSCFALKKDIGNNSIVDILYNNIVPLYYYYNNKNALCKINADGSIAKVDCSIHDSVDCAMCYMRNGFQQFDIKTDADNGYLYLRFFYHIDDHYPQFTYSYTFIDKDDDLTGSCFSCESPSITINPVTIPSSAVTKNILKWYPAFFGQPLNLTDVNYNYTVSCLEYVGFPELQSQENNLIIYPNPTSGTFTLSSSKLEINNIKIFNMLGEQVFLENFPETKTIEIQTALTAGIYYANVRSDKKYYLEKLIICR